MSYRKIGTVIGIHWARVQQIINADAGAINQKK